LPRQIRSRRKSLRLTQAALADLAGCSSRFVREVEGGKATVRLDKLLALLHALGLELRVSPRTVS
jgi:y4mF family transcriptional regulator